MGSLSRFCVAAEVITSLPKARLSQRIAAKWTGRSTSQNRITR